MSIANMLIESMMNGGEYHEMMGFPNEFMGGHGYSDYMDEDSYMYDSEDDYETLDGEDSRGTEEQKRVFKQLEDHIFKGYVQSVFNNLIAIETAFLRLLEELT